MPKKILHTLILVLLLVLLPVFSWYFIRGGLEVRLDARERLSGKATVVGENCSPGQIQIFYPVEKENRINTIRKHFHDQTILVSFVRLPWEIPTALSDSLTKVWTLVHDTKPSSDAAFLVDTSCAIVNAYDVDIDGQLANLAEDIAFLLPLEEEKDFMIKREKEK